MGGGRDFRVGVPESVDEEDYFEEVGRAADPGCDFESFEHGWAHGCGVEGRGEDAGAREG